MNFDASTYGEQVAAILRLAGRGDRLMPLVRAACISDEARQRISESLFPQARSPQGGVAGLYLYVGCWPEAHETAQNLDTPEGSYWHAIVHRQEPDTWNSGYWFGRVGRHAVFPALRDAAAQVGVDFGPRWKPEAFNEFCEQARQQPGSELERKALDVQRIEWELLFDYCAR